MSSPRTEIVAIDLFDTIAELKELLLKRLPKIVVYENSLDEIVGYVHSYDLFKKASIKAIVISVEFVPETIYIKDVMNLLTKKKRKSVAGP
jgi:CBS domain containing-hemolysin-like protein